MARRETTRHAGDENVHRRGGAREAGRARGMKTRAFGDTARDRRAMSTARQAATLESAFGDITNQYVRSQGDGRAATESKARLVGRRAAALLVDPAGLSEEISEVEEWAAALNDRGVRDARIDLERADQDMPPGGGFEDEDEDEDGMMHHRKANAALPNLRSAAAARDAELAKMRQVLEISSRVREMCDARTAELEATRAELRAAEARAAAAEASRAETEATARAAGARALALVESSRLETEAARASLADAETAAVVEASTFAAKERQSRDARARDGERSAPRARAGLRDAEMELQALVIEGEGGRGRRRGGGGGVRRGGSGGGGGCQAPRPAGARADRAEADARGRAQSSRRERGARGRAEGEEGARRRGGADGAVVADGNRRLGTDHGTRFPDSTSGTDSYHYSGTDFTSGTDDYGKDFVSREERRRGPLRGGARPRRESRRRRNRRRRSRSRARRAAPRATPRPRGRRRASKGRSAR